MVVNLEIGMVTPPIGLNLFVTAGITKMSIGQVVRAALPWLSVLLALLLWEPVLRAERAALVPLLLLLLFLQDTHLVLT